MNDDLSRKLRHWRAGVYPDSLLVLALRDVLRDLQGAGAELAVRRDDLRQIAEEALARFEKSTRDAHRRVDLCAYPEAFTSLEEAWRCLADLRTTVLAWEAHDAVQKDWSTLIAELNLERFLALPCLRIPRRLLDRARSELVARRFVKAHFVSRLVRESVEGMARQTPSSDRDLEQRIDRIREEMVSRALPELLLARLDQVRKLALQRYSRLARHLADDLEIEHLGWRAERSRSDTDLLQELTRIDAEARSVESQIALLLAHLKRG